MRFPKFTTVLFEDEHIFHDKIETALNIICIYSIFITNVKSSPDNPYTIEYDDPVRKCGVRKFQVGVRETNHSYSFFYMYAIITV